MSSANILIHGHAVDTFECHTFISLLIIFFYLKTVSRRKKIGLNVIGLDANVQWMKKKKKTLLKKNTHTQNGLIVSIVTRLRVCFRSKRHRSIGTLSYTY